MLKKKEEIEIQRQREGWTREMVSDFVDSKGFEALLSLQEQGEISISRTKDKTYILIAKEYFSDRPDNHQRLIFPSLDYEEKPKLKFKL